MTPLQRSMKMAVGRGWKAHRVEYWNPFGRNRVDLLGIGDLLVFRPRTDQHGRPQADGWEWVLVQTTSGDNHSARVTKIQQERSDNLRDWLRVPGHVVEVWSWRKAGPRLKRKLWGCRVSRVEPLDG